MRRISVLHFEFVQRHAYRMSFLSRIRSLSANCNITALRSVTNALGHKVVGRTQDFSTKTGGGGNEEEGDWTGTAGGAGNSGFDDLGWDNSSSWSTGLTKEHFDGEVVGHQVTTPPPITGNQGKSSQFNSARWTDQEMEILKDLETENRKGKAFVDGWDDRLLETSVLLKQVREPGARGSYLKDSEKAEMYRLHKENPEVYTVEKLAKDYRIMRQRVHAILWLKELEEEEEKKLGHPLDDSVELLLDTFPETGCFCYSSYRTCSMVERVYPVPGPSNLDAGQVAFSQSICILLYGTYELYAMRHLRFFNSHDREFHVATLPYKPDFRVMPEGWDGTTRDPDEVHYEISMKEDEILYQEFVQKMNFNKMKMAKQIKCHKYSRRRPSDGWNFTVEKMGPRGKRGNAGGWKFVSQADGSSRPLNELEKMFVKRETPRRRRKILP
ncbi:hypothetical protein RJ640_026568 [Escallonia rubra]|uniref:Uncharacterized protein n=1 Tax=Escallonia rubra TaxID=112253 RepID=A0AA88SAS9_9ASTE|nr:hypothetical protein RJ640_026568 [Escallonia rubra]